MAMNNKLKEILERHASVPFFGVHDALTAILAERSGFEALWLSGFCLSTVNGVRDANELSYEHVLRAIESITCATNAPLLVDADTGFGDYNTARMFAVKAKKLGAAGICIEDKQYPKLNSFANGSQQLVSPIEFGGKIRAIRDATNNELYVVARTESFIAGASVEEALSRAEHYIKSGADAILIHSKHQDFSEIESFMTQWQESNPVVIVPTTYDSTPPSVFEQHRIAGVIWANHALRATIQATTSVCEAIIKDKSPVNIKKSMVSVKDIFNLVDYDELIMAEKAYVQ